MQINGSLSSNPQLMASMASQAAAKGRQASRTDATLAAAPAAPSTGEITFRGADAPVITPAMIMERWGSSDAACDLNSDGIVNGQDLAMALDTTVNTQGTVLENWGATGDAAAQGGDYNGDGIVDAMDLAMALNGGNTPRSLESPDGGGEAPSSEQMVANIVDATFAAHDGDQDGSLVTSDFTANSKVFERLDLDHDAGVGREELTKALFTELDRFRTQFPEARPEAFARRWMDTLTTDRPVPNYGQFQRLQQLYSNPASLSSNAQILSARA